MQADQKFGSIKRILLLHRVEHSKFHSAQPLLHRTSSTQISTRFEGWFLFLLYWLVTNIGANNCREENKPDLGIEMTSPSEEVIERTVGGCLGKFTMSRRWMLLKHFSR